MRASVPSWALAALAALVVPAAVGQSECHADRAAVDAGADGLLSPADPLVSLPGDLGPSSNEGHLGRSLLPLGGTLSFFDVDGDGALGKGEVWLLDRGAAGPTVGDIVLSDGRTADDQDVPFGTVLAVGAGRPAGSVRPVAGGVLAFMDDNGDGAHQPGEGLYASRGPTVQPNDVRLWVPEHAPGSLVQPVDPDRGAALVTGPSFGFLDQDGSGTFVVHCPGTSTSPPTGPASTTTGSTPPTATTTTAAPDSTTPPVHGDPCEAFGGPCPDTTGSDGGGKGSPLGAWVAVVALAAVAAVRRRL